MPTRKEWPEVMRAIAEERVSLSTKKNANYAGGDLEDDAFANFALVETLTHGKITQEAGIFVRMCDKMARLGNLLFGTPDLVGESVEDTLKDLANYSDILLQSLREKREMVPYEDEQEELPTDEAPAEESASSILSRFLHKSAH